MDTVRQAISSENYSEPSDLNFTEAMWNTTALDYTVGARSTYPGDYYYMWGNESYTFEYDLLKQPPSLLAIYCIAYGLVFIIALLGNGLVLALVIREPSMRNVTNYFIVNLAVADYFVTLIIVPMTLLNSIFSGRYNTYHHSIQIILYKQ